MVVVAGAGAGVASPLLVVKRGARLRSARRWCGSDCWTTSDAKLGVVIASGGLG